MHMLKKGKENTIEFINDSPYFSKAIFLPMKAPRKKKGIKLLIYDLDLNVFILNNLSIFEIK